MLEIRQLQYFLAVAEQLNFSKAANLLYVTQPLLSQQIAEMEGQLGVKLFQRTRRYVKLTMEGMVLQQEARAIIDRVENLDNVVRRAHESGEVQVTMEAGIEQLFERTRLTQGIREFRRRYPAFPVNIHLYAHGELVQALNKGKIDIGFLLSENESAETDLNMHVLWEDHLALVAAKEDGMRMSDNRIADIMLSNRPLLLLTADPRGLNHVLRLCQMIGIAPQFRFAENIQELLAEVESGSGYSVLPKGMAETYASPFIEILPLEPSEDSKIFLCVGEKMNKVHPAATYLLECIRSVC